MTIHFNPAALLFGVLAVTQAACAGPSGANRVAALPSGRVDRLPRSSAPDRGPSWVSPASTGQTLLYISDEAAGTVRMYSYPAGKLEGTLTKLNQPAGLCADPSGNVWVVENGNATIAKFAHGGKKAMATLITPGAQNLLGCAIDPGSGDLAATSLNGNLLVYTNAKGNPSEYQDGTFAALYFCTYDGGGNLFVDGVNFAGAFGLAELPIGSGSLHDVTVNGSVHFPGGMQWDGSHVATGDQEYKGANASAIYQISVSGSSGTIVGTTVLGGSCDVLGFAIASGQVAAPDACEADAGLYKYPAGGKRTRTLKGLTFPIGAAISQPSGRRTSRSNSRT